MTFVPDFNENLYFVGYTYGKYSLHKTNKNTSWRLPDFKIDLLTFETINNNLPNFIATGSLENCFVVIDNGGRGLIMI